MEQTVKRFQDLGMSNTLMRSAISLEYRDKFTFIANSKGNILVSKLRQKIDYILVKILGIFSGS